MSISALIRAMAAAGAPPEAIALAVEAVEVSASKLDERRAGERERKRRQRDKSRDNHGTVTGQSQDTPSPAPLPPRPPNPTPPSANVTTTREADRRLAEGFERFWAEYPRKVGKPLALKAYAKACAKIAGPDPPGEILAGLRVHLPGWAQGEPEFVPHPTSWLNRDGWTDQPTTPRASNGQRSNNHPGSAASRSADRLQRIIGGSEVAARVGGYDFGS